MTTQDEDAVELPAHRLEEVFYPVTRQLIAPPPESDAVMAQVLATGKVPEGYSIEDFSSRGPWKWRGYNGIREEYGWNPTTLTLRFPQEGGRYDVLRLRYRAAGWVLELAESKHMWALRVMGDDLVGPGLGVARRVAKEIFMEEWDIRLIYLGRSGEITFGKHDYAATGRAAQFQHWRDTLRWWHQPGLVAFASMQASGHPQRWRCPGQADEPNRYWFTPNPNEPE